MYCGFKKLCRILNYIEGPNRFGTGLCRGSYSPVDGGRRRIQTVAVVVMAAMVPMGIDFWASRRSPERLEPAMIPEQIVVNVINAKHTRDSMCWEFERQHVFTRHRGEVDSNQQRKEAGDVSQHVAVCAGQGVVLLFHRMHVFFGNQVSLLIVGPKQVLWIGEKEQSCHLLCYSQIKAG